jgi:thiol:disulfide interchange protein DsbC
MIRNVPPQEAACDDSSVSNVLALGEKLEVNSTPTLFLADGRRVEGVLTHDQMERELANTDPKVAAATARP